MEAKTVSSIFDNVSVVSNRHAVIYVIEDLLEPVTGKLSWVVSISDVPMSSTLVLFDLDATHDLDFALQALMSFRIATPTVPVALFSESFARDDYGLERLQIADASLSWPFGLSRIEQLQDQLAANNKVWQERCLGRNPLGGRQPVNRTRSDQARM